MPSVRIEIPPELVDEIESQSLEHGLSRQKVVQKLLKDRYALICEDSLVTRGFDSIMERQYLKFRLEEAGLRYQKLLREHEELKATFEITIKKIKTPWWIRFKNWLSQL